MIRPPDISDAISGTCRFGPENAMPFCGMVLARSADALSALIPLIPTFVGSARRSPFSPNPGQGYQEAWIGGQGGQIRILEVRRPDDAAPRGLPFPEISHLGTFSAHAAPMHPTSLTIRHLLAAATTTLSTTICLPAQGEEPPGVAVKTGAVTETPRAENSAVAAAEASPAYHVELAVVDGLSLGFLGAGLLHSEHSSAGLKTALVGTGGAGVILGAPIMHLLKKDAEHSVGSLMLRLGVPALGLIVGYNATKCAPPNPQAPGEECDGRNANMVVGGLIALPVAMVLDNILLAGPSRTEARSRSTWNLLPMVDPSRGSAGLGVAGFL